MWAIAQDEGWVRSIEEFGKITPGMFERLMKRRAVRHKYACLYAGMIASSVGNFAGKCLNEGVHLSPMDFVPKSEERRRKEELRSNVLNFVGFMGAFFPKTSGEEIKEKVIESLVQGGLEQEEVEAMLRELFPAWNVKVN